MARSTATATVSTLPVTTKAVGTIAALCDELSGTFAERREVIRATARAFLAGEHTFILGAPGTAKSALVRSFAQALGLSYWEYLMTRYSTPEELFGPLSIPELQKGRYTRNYARYLPGAQVVFLDEIWKSNSGILNALLKGLNERLFDDDGGQVKMPLVSCVGASNELPESESELAALYDRFLVRLVTQYIADRDAFEAMVFDSKPFEPSVVIDLAAEQAQVREVEVPTEVRKAFVELRTRCVAYKVSDRRWKQCVRLIQASAHLEGRTVATTDDLECLEDVLWRVPEEKTAVATIIQDVATPGGAEAVKLLDNARRLLADLPTCDPKNTTPFVAAAGGANKDLAEILNRLATLPPSRKLAAVRDEVSHIKTEVVSRVLEASGIKR